MNANQSNIVLFHDGAIEKTNSSYFFEELERLENELDRTEETHGVLFVPSYIGIRQSYKNFCRAMSLAKLSDSEQANIEIQKATDELIRARHDSIKAFIGFAHFRLLSIEKLYDGDHIFQVCSEYFEIKNKMIEISEKIDLELPRMHLSEADKFFVELSNDYIPKLYSVYKKLSLAEDVSLSKKKENSEAEERYRKLSVVGFGVGVIGTALAIVSIFL